MHILEVFKEKLDFNLDICWFKLEKYTFFKIKFQFLKIFLHCFLFHQQSFFNHLTSLEKTFWQIHFIKKFVLLEKNMLLFLIVLTFVVDVLEFLSAYFGVYSAYFGSFKCIFWQF